MKKTIIYLFGLLMVSAAFMACDDPYADQFVAEPEVNEQGPIQSADGFTFALGSGVSSAVVLADADLVAAKALEVVKATATPQLADGAFLKYKVEVSDTKDFINVIELPAVSANNAATVNAVDLNETVKTLFGKAPFAREVFIRATPVLIDGDTKVQLTTHPVFGPVLVTPVGMVIETEYYLIGDLNDWNINDLEVFKFSHSGKDVYEDPNFSILVNTMLNADGNGYFKIVPKSSKDAASWTGVLGNPVDGNTALEGELIIENSKAMRVTEPGWVKITLNMMEYTYKIELIGEVVQTLYMPGGYQGWTPATAPTVFTRNLDFKYEGYVNFQESTEFKFTEQPDWDGTNYGDGGDGTLSTTGGNLSVAEAGYYKVNVDLSGNPYTYSLVKTDWGLIGSATSGGWDNSTPMTYDPAAKLWTVTTTLKAEEFKFRANNGWDINLGGDMNNLNYGGDNIKVTEVGTYLVTLDLSNPAAYKASIVKQ
ncbi:MAG: SusF/SusE family outer membrane protein [Bacteroidia bacterium]|nr:SusF/SusE family outer membrane protein [Bacteroidia bacterium]